MMLSPFRIAALVLAPVLGACAARSSPPRTCETHSECPSRARCIAGACVANGPPLAVIALPDTLQTYVLLTFDGSTSSDPDPGDAVVTYAWTFRSLGANCTPPVVADTEPLARVRFACAGRYAVDLTVTDQLGRSATTTNEIEVAEMDGPALVEVGPDIAVDHACTTVPMRCAPTTELALSASAPAVSSPDLKFSWTVEPPSNRPLDAARRVIFTPSALVAAPTVSVETDGESISGDWVFRVEAHDSAGVIGSAAMRVSISNRPPVIQKSIPTPAHSFGGTVFTATGEIPFAISDPDGDPLFGPLLVWHHAGDGGGSFSGHFLSSPSRLAFSIEVPYGSPADALHLIGGDALERSVAFEVSDVNGAIVSEVWSIVVGNRRPVLVSDAQPFTVSHFYDTIARAYRAIPPLSTWFDPDGDPMVRVPTADTGDPSCPSFQIQAGSGLAVADCRVAFQTSPGLATFAGTHTVIQTVQDPWTPATQTSTVTFAIGNRPPAIKSAEAHIATGPCTIEEGCCILGADGCAVGYYTAPESTSVVPSRWSDPDGDPLDVQVAPCGSVTPVQPLVCTPSECALEIVISARANVCGSFQERLSTVVSDGLESVMGALDVVRECSR